MKILIIISLLFATVAQAAVVEDAKVVKGDTLSISIKGVPQEEQAQINGNYPVNSKGKLFLPYLVKVPMAVQGLTCKAIARNIEKAYKEAKIYTTPVILVQKTREHKSGCGGCRLPIGRFLTVSGDVRRPGPQAYRPGLTLMDLVSVATPYKKASLGNVILLRNGKTYKYDLRIAAHQKERMYPNDQITLKGK